MTLLSEAQRIYTDLASVERDLRISEREAGLAARITSLHSDERIVLALLHVEELTCEQVAKVMGRKVEDVKLLQASALVTLRSAPQNASLIRK